LNGQATRSNGIPLWVAIVPVVLFLTVFAFAAMRTITARGSERSNEIAQQISDSIQQRNSANVDERSPDISGGSGASYQPSSPSPPTLPTSPTSPPPSPMGNPQGATPAAPPNPQPPARSGGATIPAGQPAPEGSGANLWNPAPNVTPRAPVPRGHLYHEMWRATPYRMTPEPHAAAKQAALPSQGAPQPLPDAAPRPAATQPTANRTLYSTFFPLNLGESRMYFAQGHLQRMLLLYANLSNRPAPQTRLVLDLPQDFSVEKVAMTQPDGSVSSNYTTTIIRRGQQTYLRCSIPMFTVPAHFKGKGPNGIWDRWQGWWSYLYVTPQTKPGAYRIYWSLQSSAAREPEQSVEAEVLPPVPVAQVGNDARVGAWLYRLLDYQEDQKFEQRLVAELRRIGVGKLVLTMPPSQTSHDDHAGLVRTNQRAVKFARKQGITPFGVNWWASWASAPGAPPVFATAVTARGRRVNAWCPSFIADRGPAFRTALKQVTDAVRKMGVDGFTLDYRTAFSPQFADKDVCFDDRCRRRFMSFAKISQLDFPHDALPGGTHHQKWLDFRAWQKAEYTKALGDAVWAANKKAVVETWTNAAEAAASDSLQVLISNSASQLAPRVNRVLISLALLPTTKPPVDVTTLVKDAVSRAKPASVTVGIMAGPSLSASLTSRPDLDALNYQVLNCIADGAKGIDLWGLGVLDDARIAHLASRWSTLLALSESHIESGNKVETAALKIERGNSTAAVRLVAYQRPGQQLVVLLNGTSKEQPVQLHPTRSDQKQTVRDLMSGRQLGVVSGNNTLRVAVAPHSAQFLTTQTDDGGWRMAVRRFFGGE
jgi:hypothetical protein